MADKIATKAALTAHAALTNPHSATAANTASRIVLRDGSGNFAAGKATLSAALVANSVAAGTMSSSASVEITNTAVNVGNFAGIIFRSEVAEPMMDQAFIGTVLTYTGSFYKSDIVFGLKPDAGLGSTMIEAARVVHGGAFRVGNPGVLSSLWTIAAKEQRTGVDITSIAAEAPNNNNHALVQHDGTDGHFACDGCMKYEGGAGGSTYAHEWYVYTSPTYTSRARMALVTGAFTIDSSLTVGAGFGCNAKAAQAAYASGGALATYGAGANGFDTAAHASALHAMVVSIRAALVANGVMS